MAGNARIGSPSASSSELGSAGTYSNGHRRIHSAAVGPSLDKPGSFREGAERRRFGSGAAVSRAGISRVVVAGDMPPLSQCLSLEPIVMSDQKIMRSGELRRAMRLSVGSTNEENTFGASAQLKSSPPMAVLEDLKDFKLSVVDTFIKARGRTKKLDEYLHKLDTYCEAVTSNKQQRNDLITNNRAGALNLKTGMQIYRNPSELRNQRVEDQPKNVLLNKRVRTSVAETRAECRSNSLQRQPVLMVKDRNLLKENGGESNLVEEKIRKLPARGEGWDKKIKRKRSVGTVFTRSIDSYGEPKRAVRKNVVDEPDSQPNNAHIYRLGASNGTGGTDKLDGASLPYRSNARRSLKNEQDGPFLSKDLKDLTAAGSNKERILTKGSNKLNNHDDYYTTCRNPVAKIKASRTPRTGSMVAAVSSPSIPRVHGTLETWENATGANKIPSTGGASSRKCAVPTGSPSQPMAQWSGQRPQKMSRTRRANLVSPVSDQDEKQLSSDSCSPSNIGARSASNGTNGSPILGNAPNSFRTEQFKVKHEKAQSPLKLSESEKSIGGESRLRDKRMGNTEANAIAVQYVAPSVTPTKKNKPLLHEENGGVRKQGRIGRGPLIARAVNATTPKPLQNSRPSWEKNGRGKSGRPLKKLSERKGFARLGHLQNHGSPDTTGESDDDREELLAAANHARNTSDIACSNASWKKMEPLFASVSLEDMSHLSQQMDLRLEDSPIYHKLTSGERNGHLEHQESESFLGELDSDRTSSEFIPLYKRVLSALIMEDNIDELEKEEAGNIRVQDAFHVSVYNAYCPNDSEQPRKRAQTEICCDTAFGVYSQSHPENKYFSSNGGLNSIRSPSINNSTCEDLHSEGELLAGISKNLLKGPQTLCLEGHGVSSLECGYEQMRLDDKLLLELQSIGLYPETVPDLVNMEDEVIKHEVDQLKKRLQQQIAKTKTYLEKIHQAVGSSPGGRDLERAAMDRLVELAYRKLLATRGTSKGGIPKVAKAVALAFGRRTLGRCREYENRGSSCFNEPPLRHILFAPRKYESKVVSSVERPDSRLSSDEAFAINGPNTEKKKQLSLHNVGSIVSSGTKGKRSERDVAKGGHASYGTNSKGDRKPKPKSAHSPTHPVQPWLVSHGDREKSKEGVDSSDLSFRNGDLDPMDELGVNNNDLGSLLNFDDEDLQDHFSAGLDIPMDDLTELNMF